MFKATGREFYPLKGITKVYDALYYFVKEKSAIVYPREMGINSHGFVDLACINPDTEEMYGFEIKEKGDSIATGIEQSKNYQSGFDYVYIAGTVKPNKTTLMRMERLKIGYIQVIFEHRLAKIHCRCIAPLNRPMPKVRSHLFDKFVTYSEFGKI